MRVARILTNETCDHRCAFCNTRRDRERVSVASSAALRQRLDAVHQAGVQELVLTGGEPSLRRDLPAIVARARRIVEKVVLETNGSGIGPAVASKLATSGLTRARVHLPAWGEALDRIVRHEGAWLAVTRAVAALHAVGVELEAAVPVVRDNLEHVAALPEQLCASGWPIDRIRVAIPYEGPAPETLAPLDAAARAVDALTTAARSRGIAVQLEPATFVPPCVFPRPAAVAHLYTLGPGGANRPGVRRVDGCASCRVADRCPGLPTALQTVTVHPIAHDRVRRRLSVIGSVEAQIARELVTHEIYRRSGGETVPATVVRIDFRCNQACRFCFVSTHLPPPEDADVEAAIDDNGRRRGVLVLSGGEPTLHPDLPRLVRRGKAAGACEVELQTNAVRLADPALVEALVEAGVDAAFVSLHGACAETSDAITRAPGTFDQTVLGLDNLAATPLRVRINFVLCGPNHREFPRFVQMVARRWPKAAITVSFVGLSTDLVPRSRELVPRYTDVLPALREGLAIAAREGVEVDGFDSMCGIPLCLVPGDRRRFYGLAPIPEGYDRGEFVRADACRACALRDRCFGLRRNYADLYGASELHPVLPDGIDTSAPT